MRSNEPWKTLETPRIKGWAMSLLYQDGFARLRELFSLGRRPQDYHIRQAVEHPRVLPLFVEYLYEAKIERLWDYHLPLPQRQALVRRLSRTPPSITIKLSRSKTLITRLVTPAWLQYNQTGHPDKDHLPKLIKRHPWLFVYYLNPSTSPRLAGILNQKIKRPWEDILNPLLWQLLDIDALQPSNPHLCRALRMPGVARLSLCQLLQMDPIPVREVAKELWLHDLQEGERLDLPINEPPKRAAEVAQLFNFGIQDILAATLSALYRRVNGPTPNWSALGFLMWQKLPISQTWLPPSTAGQRRNAFTSNMDGIRFLLAST